MTIRFGLLICSGLSLLASAALAENEGPRCSSGNELSAQVTIPYQEFKRLLDAASVAAKPEDSPDIAGAITRAQIKLSLDPQRPSGEAEFDINTFGHKWVLVPFVGLDLPITNVACESGTIIPRDGLLCLLTNQSGQSKVVVDFDLPTTFVAGGGDTISLRLAPAAAGQIEFGNVPPGKRILVGGKAVEINRPFPLLVAGGEIKITCVGGNPESPTVWSQITQTLVEPTLEAIEVESHIHLSSPSGSGLSAETELPVTASKLEIEGPDLQPAQIGMSGSGHRKITLNWETTGVLDRSIILRYQLPNAEPGRPWEIENPRFGKELSPQTCLTVVTPLPGTAVQSDYGQTGSDVTQLPHWIQSKLITPEFYEIRSVNPAKVSTRLLPVLKPDNARISTAAYQTSLVPDGSLKCEALFKIEYRSTFSWRFRLPQGSTLLDCQMNSAPASPVVKADGELELSIPAPANSGNFNSLQISITYTAHSSKFEPVEGKLNLSLPSTQLFIERVEWRLYLPDNYEATAFEGNVEPAGEDNTAIVFKKRLVRAETPNLEVYYRRKQGTQPQ
ncbi:MAG: hypothetical protein JO025_15115 [Verrucomicrobia bacterium]|nr:hypothetical protein [Verrucomicrobiota bacterium]